MSWNCRLGFQCLGNTRITVWYMIICNVCIWWWCWCRIATILNNLNFYMWLILFILYIWCILHCRVYLVPSTQSTSADNSTHRELLLHVLSVPAFMNHLQIMCNEIYNRYISERLFTHSLLYLSQDDRLQAIAVTLEGNRTLCLLGMFQSAVIATVRYCQ